MRSTYFFFVSMWELNTQLFNKKIKKACENNTYIAGYGFGSSAVKKSTHIDSIHMHICISICAVHSFLTHTYTYIVVFFKSGTEQKKILQTQFRGNFCLKFMSLSN